jgi:tryptophan halogenase
VNGTKREILVVGGGTAGWTVAAALARALGATAAVGVLDTPAAPDSGVLGEVEAAAPALGALHRLIGFDEDRLVREHGAVFRLGTEHLGFAGDDSAWLHPCGDYGATLDGVPFLHLWLKAREADVAAPLDAYVLAAVAARRGRFARPSADPRSVASTMSYGLHAPVAGYAAAMRRTAEALGARRVGGGLAAVETAGERIAAVRSADGGRLEADLYLDCTGPAAALLRAVGAKFKSWSPWLPCDRLRAAEAAADGAPGLLTRVRATARGWRSEAPLQGRLAATEVWAAAERDDPSALRFAQGRLDRPWIGNAVAIGLSAGVLEPLEGAGLHMVQSAVVKLIALFPTADGEGGEAAEFNRLLTEEYDRFRDFLIARYALNGRSGPFWEERRMAGAPDTLRYKLDLFRSRGRVAMYDEEAFLEPSWIALFLGLGVTPRRRHPAADRFQPAALDTRLRRIADAMRAGAEAMPPHAEYLAAVARRSAAA